MRGFAELFGIHTDTGSIGQAFESGIDKPSVEAVYFQQKLYCTLGWVVV